ncbi:hypothetical protein BH18ACI3_BH18ACI3_18410 [soil metagenome]
MHGRFSKLLRVRQDTRFDYGEERWIGIGSLGNRIVAVVFTEPDDELVRIISLRKAFKRERTNLNKKSKTDWARIDAMTDDDIDTSDIPELDDDFFASAELRMPKNKTSVMLSVDTEVLEWFESQGAEFQQRINAALRIYAEAHRR